jgi:hypothetical protein
MSSKRAGKRAASARTGRKKLGLTRGSVRDLPAGDCRAPSVKGGAVKKVWTAGNDQPQTQ